nr:aminotransferase class IV [Desulforamulus aquiferis]
MSINGRLLLDENNLLSPLSWACSYGYGLFETILVQMGRPLFLKQHLQRMAESADALGLFMPAKEVLNNWIEELLIEATLRTGRLKISLLGDKKAAGEDKLQTNTLLILQEGIIYQADLYELGVEIGLLGLSKNEQSHLVRHKTLNYMENILAREQANGQGWFEGLFVNSQQRVCEGTISNIFIVKDGIIKTPGPREGLLSGITRQLIIDLAQDNLLPCVETKIYPGELIGGEELFITNSLMGVMPVTKFAGTPIGKGVPGRVTSSIRKIYQELLDKEIQA